MSRSWRNVGRRTIALVIGPACALAGLLAWLTGARPPWVADRPGTIVVPAEQGPPGLLRCRLRPVAAPRQRESLGCWELFRMRPDLLSRVCRNPLVADDIDIEIENTSDAEVLIYPNGKELDSSGYRRFWVQTRLEDADGRPAHFGRRPDGFKRLGRASAGGGRPVAMAPGETVRLTAPLFCVRFDADIRPGKYTGRVVCGYVRAPGDVEEEVVSAPFQVTITEGDVRGLRRLWYALGSGRSDWIISLL